MIRIHALTVCVNYSDMLALGVKRWAAGLSSWTIVTDMQDEQTVALAREHNLQVFRTDVFYDRAASFNKGAAMEQARQMMPWQDWILFIDADVVPEINWRQKIEEQALEPGKFYGCWRLDAPNAAYIDREEVPVVHDDRVGYGYFQLFHSGDPYAQSKPLLDVHWTHGGNYDSTFLLRWPRAEMLPLKLWHIGGVSHNWFGRNRINEFRAMEQERARRGGGWPSIAHEHIAGMPTTIRTQQ